MHIIFINTNVNLRELHLFLLHELTMRIYSFEYKYVFTEISLTLISRYYKHMLKSLISLPCD
jgi:hypothetical protein